MQAQHNIFEIALTISHTMEISEDKTALDRNDVHIEKNTFQIFQNVFFCVLQKTKSHTG